MAREDLVEVDPAQPLGSKPHGEFARKALVPRLVPEAPAVGTRWWRVTGAGVTYMRPPMNS